MSSWFGGSSTVGGRDSHRDSHRHSSSHHHRRSPSPKKYFVRPHSPARSTTSSYSRASTLGGIFSSRGHKSSTSRYKRGPRDGYVARIVHTIKKLLRDLYDYARRHPVKVFMLVAMPLITGGALQGLLKTVGISLPAGLAAVMGGAGGGGHGGGGYGARSDGGGGSGGVGLEQVVSIAKMFM